MATAIRILTLAQLPAAHRAQLGTLPLLDGDPPVGWELVRRVRRSGLPVSGYFGVYAIAGDQLLAHVETLRLVVTTDHGRESAVGLADVLTRPDALGRGLASRLIEDVHRRSRREGLDWSLLWTHRTWGAHRLYERLGYRDVYSPPAALKQI
ncbi:MAG: GNAT family N-acetyltransferase, partial [Thermoplasmata archaeon]|nr:GNAT family N-acetyltransferase [Thermoplasmata archaeon]